MSEFDPSVPHTFHEWSNAGFKIKKGTRSLFRNEAGAAIFNPDQVILLGESMIDGEFRDYEDELREW